MSATIAMRLAEVRHATGLTKTAIYQMQRRGQFPRAVKISQRAVAWRSDEIEQWIESRTAARDAGAAQ
ncbi:helix-turn-helix transcriptional regulator [Metallibacterium scheffleri]